MRTERTTKAMAASQAVDWDRLRALFPTLQRKTFLNSCAYGALAISVREAFERYLAAREENGTDWNWWVAQNELLRSAMAEFLGVEPDEIAITPSASAGINALASALKFDGPRNKVVISDFEFPTNGQIWYAQELRQARVVRVPAIDGYIPAESFEAAIDEQTLLVAVTKVCYRNGARLDVAAIAEIARRKGALMFVDGYQALGSMNFNARKAGIDFLVGGNLKYLLGTAGVGFMYVRKALIESLVPTVTGWFAQRDIGAMDHTRYRPAMNARRFEMGTPPVPNTYAAEAGIRILQGIGMAAVEARIAELTASIIAKANAAGYVMATPQEPARHGAMIAIRSSDEQALVARLDKENIVTSCRDGNLRVAVHFYNTEHDIEQLFRALTRHKDLMRFA